MSAVTVFTQSIAHYPACIPWHASKAALRQMRLLSIYGAFYCIAISTLLFTHNSTSHALALGLIFPGGGFWNSSMLVATAIGLSFILSLMVWFATGNIVAPILIWILSLIAAPALALPPEATSQLWGAPVLIVAMTPPLLIFAYIATRVAQRHIGGRRRSHLNRAILTESSPNKRPPSNDELSLDDLNRQRLLLDRALQPVENFDGFEWIDQFQTSAVRYQLNFVSYALSIAQAEHTPAFKGYVHTAQDNLLAKQEDPRIWGYWKLENMWGNLRASADPIACDNIMYSGFVAAQITYRNNAVSYPLTNENKGLNCHAKSGQQFDYSLDELIKTLHVQYTDGAGGLLPCEPNWVYPLCNAITASAIRAHDSATAQQLWPSIRDGFQRSLETDYTTPDGRLVPFRSSYTGFAPPLVGGAVMQAFPCYFLNSTMPEIAERQWMRLQDEMRHKDWRRALWPIDVGNYKFSRASSYAATAAAAREMGDHETADHLLGLLDEDCPAQARSGLLYRPKASLWAHANEMMARAGTTNTLQRIATRLASKNTAMESPYLTDIAYPDILVSKAVSTGRQLDLALYPGKSPGIKGLTIDGLIPSTEYKISMAVNTVFMSDARGSARLNLPINGRTPLRIHPSQLET